MTAGRGMKTIAKWQSDRLRQGEGGWQLGGQQGSKAERQWAGLWNKFAKRQKEVVAAKCSQAII